MEIEDITNVLRELEQLKHSLSAKAQQLIKLTQRRKSDAKCWNH